MDVAVKCMIELLYKDYSSLRLKTLYNQKSQVSSAKICASMRIYVKKMCSAAGTN